jgi:hypothetical protein
MPRSCGTTCCFQWRSQRRPRHEATLSSRLHRMSPRHGELSQEPARRHHRKPRTAPTSGSAPPGSKGISPVAADLAARARASAAGPAGAASAPAQAPGWGSAPCDRCSDPCPSPPRRLLGASLAPSSAPPLGPLSEPPRASVSDLRGGRGPLPGRANEIRTARRVLPTGRALVVRRQERVAARRFTAAGRFDPLQRRARCRSRQVASNRVSLFGKSHLHPLYLLDAGRHGRTRGPMQRNRTGAGCPGRRPGIPLP